MDKKPRVNVPLRMKGGEEVRNLEGLREHFDFDLALEYYCDDNGDSDGGRLTQWLTSFGHESEAEKVKVLDPSKSDFKQKLCEILGVPYESEFDKVDCSVIKNKIAKRDKLREITSNPKVLENVDRVACSQEDLEGLLAAGGIREIYLCGDDTFNISLKNEGITYIGGNSGNSPKLRVTADGSGNGIFIKDIADVVLESIDQWFLNALNETDFATAKNLWWWIAEHSETDEQRQAGKAFLAGANVEQSQETTFECLRKAAHENENALIMYLVGYCYKHSKGTYPYEGRARYWMKYSAEMGYAEAQYELGNWYMEGWSVAKNEEKALEWYRKAAEQGHEGAKSKVEELAEAIPK
jgi:hypothetical protein